MQIPSRILQSLREGSFPTVMKINLCDPRSVEIAGFSGVDAIWLCNEHVPTDWLGLENQIRAARVHRMDCLVRVSKGSYSEYIRPLEAGATGIIVPHVTTASEAKQIVEWTRFSPVGKRSVDGGNIDGHFSRVPIKEYLDHSNRERLIILQIESPEGLEQVEAIAAVAGINGLMFGAGDFGHRIGKIGEFEAEEVTAARKRVGAACLQHGKMGMTARLYEPLPELLKEGYQVLTIGADVIGLNAYVEDRLAFTRRGIGEKPGSSKAIGHTYG